MKKGETIHDSKTFESFPELSDGNVARKENLEMGARLKAPIKFLPLDLDDYPHGREIEANLKTLFEVAKEESFEEGVENEFSKGLISIIKEFGADLIQILANYIFYRRANEEVASEALRWLGRLDHPESYDQRLFLLIDALDHPSARIRDAASVGLITLGDAYAIPYLEQAIQREACIELREDMQQILESLESAR